MGARLRFPTLSAAALGGIVLLIGGCSTGGGVREQLDAATGITWLAAAEPGVYARTDPRYSRAARDYVYIGPVESNARGLREYFLWVGLGTTLDRGFLVPDGESVERIVLLLDGEPVDLDLFPWQTLIPGTESIEPYDPPVRPLVELGARVTRDLLMRIDAAAPAVVRLSGEGGKAREFFAWTTVPRWPGLFPDDSVP